MYLVIWFRSIPLWICVGGKGKSEKLIRHESTNTYTTKTYVIMYVQLFIQNIICLVYLLPLTAAHLTCALQWWVSPYFLHLWHPDICKRKTRIWTSWLFNLCQRKSADRSRIVEIHEAGNHNLDDERGKTMARVLISVGFQVFSGHRLGLHTVSKQCGGITHTVNPTHIHSFFPIRGLT